VRASLSIDVCARASSSSSSRSCPRTFSLSRARALSRSPLFAPGRSGKRVAALTDVLDLAGIAACDAHIISTSSFSWYVLCVFFVFVRAPASAIILTSEVFSAILEIRWGAFLNDKPQKRLVVPTPWFNPAHPMGDAMTDTMHPPDWISLSLL
jgi:hypothetical protein